MTEFLGWIACAGDRVLVERIVEEGGFHVVRLCTACGGFERGHELRVPRSAFLPCAPRGSGRDVPPATMASVEG